MSRSLYINMLTKPKCVLECVYVLSEEMLMKDNSIYIKQFLLQLADGDVPDKCVGICYNLHNRFRVIEKHISLRSQTWKYHSGDDRYPVSIQGFSPRVAYHKLPLWKGEYGEKRKQLAEYLATQDWSGVEAKVSLWTKIKFHFTGCVL